jgi:hypothetical protein
MAKAVNRDTREDAQLDDEQAPLPVGCLRCGGLIEEGHLGLKVFRHSRELGSVCHDCAWDGNGHAILNEDELEGWLHSVA